MLNNHCSNLIKQSNSHVMQWYQHIEKKNPSSECDKIALSNLVVTLIFGPIDYMAKQSKMQNMVKIQLEASKTVL